MRILIATDAAREGLNLQAHCWNLFHFDVPWNPGRMEQRNGRIDRKLQPKNEVYCHYFYYAQRPEDRILKVLVEKTKRIREELGSLSQVIEGRLNELIKGGIRRKSMDQLEHEIETADLEAEQRRTVEEELESARARQDDLRGQIQRLRNMLGRSQAVVAFNEEHFRSTISCVLELTGAEPLTRGSAPADSSKPRRWVFPAVDQRSGADPTWANTLDALRKPRDRNERFWNWRRDSPIREVVFEDPGEVTEEVVQLHLEHRVVRRLLSRFVAQGAEHQEDTPRPRQAHSISPFCSSESLPGREAAERRLSQSITCTDRDGAD